MKNPVQISRLISVPLTDVWKREDSDFTPWLSEEENLELLGEAIDVRLELEGIEQSVGRYFADIVCKDVVTGEYVIIENQIRPTDHTHLGQICTYAAGLKASKVVWIAPEIKDEHREAIDWLNSISNDDTSFYAVEVQAWKIDDSHPAPKFEVVSQPQLLSRQARKDAKKLSETGLSEGQLKWMEYWTDFIKLAQDFIPAIKNRTPYKGCWQTVGSQKVTPSSYIEFNCYASRTNIRSEAYLGGADAKLVFHALEKYKNEIEAAFGHELFWQENPGKQDCRIAAILPNASVDYGLLAKDHHVWMAKTITKLMPIIIEFEAKLDLVNAAKEMKMKESE